MVVLWCLSKTEREVRWVLVDAPWQLHVLGSAGTVTGRPPSGKGVLKKEAIHSLHVKRNESGLLNKRPHTLKEEFYINSSKKKI